jgi:coenzyme F420 biosynthesis associated uncharacterized protein
MGAVIDWSLAARLAATVAGGDARPNLPGDLARAADDSERLVGAYTGLVPTTPLPAAEAVTRAQWTRMAVDGFRPLLDPVADRLGEGLGPLRGPVRGAAGMVLAAELGLLTGYLGQRVLGQYDLALLDETTTPRLLLLAPNLAIAARNLSVDRDELVLWVAIHEITHAVQFTGASWLRGHIGGMLRELIDGLQVSLAGRSETDGDGAGWRERLKLPDPSELREFVERARSGELLRLTLGEDRWALVERMQAAMSLIEGHAEHTMDAIGADVLPSLPRLRAAMTRRRESRGLPWRVLERLLGLEMKMRQYEVGRRFCDAVVQQGGREALARVWSGPEQLPSADELEHPARWLERTAAANDGSIA